MNEISWYAVCYLVCSAIAAVAALARVARRMTDVRQVTTCALALPLVFIYLLGMYRTAGVDYQNYFDAYFEVGQAIPDIGYTVLTSLARKLGLGLNTFLLCQGIFTLAVLWIVSKQKNADPIVVIVIYLLHLAIVRDLSQSRVGLAVAIYLLGQTKSQRIFRIMLYACAASVHLTVLVLIAVWSATRVATSWKPATQTLLFYSSLVAIAFYGNSLLNLAGAIDPRIDYYLGWEEDGYGAPLASMSALLRAVPVVICYIWASHRFPKRGLSQYIAMELFGAAILIGLSDFSVFAARLSNVAISMYPIGLGIVASAYCQARVSPSAGSRSNGWILKLSLSAMLLILIARPGSVGTLVEVMPTRVEWLD